MKEEAVEGEEEEGSTSEKKGKKKVKEKRDDIEMIKRMAMNSSPNRMTTKVRKRKMMTKKMKARMKMKNEGEEKR